MNSTHNQIDLYKIADEELLSYKNQIEGEKERGSTDYDGVPIDYLLYQIIEELEKRGMKKGEPGSTIEHIIPDNNQNHGLSADELDKEFLHAPSHGLLADIMNRDSAGRIIFIPLNLRDGQHFYKNVNKDYWSEMRGIRSFARKSGEEAIDRAFQAERKSTDNIKDLYSDAGKAIQRVRTRDFLHGAITLFNEKIIKTEIDWNATPECLPLIDGIIDYTGKKIIRRRSTTNEYFRNPLPYFCNDILNAGKPTIWLRFLESVYPDVNDRQMSRFCDAAILANKPQKFFEMLINLEGNGGKNTKIDSLSLVLPGRVKAISNSLILKHGDPSEKRFGAAELEGALLAYFDEVGGTFDTASIKRTLTSLSPIRVERKGQDPIEITVRAVSFFLSNEYPNFYPSTDTGFTSRSLILIHRSVYYPDEETRKMLIERGVDSSRLHPARPHDEILRDVMAERQMILNLMIRDYIELRDRYRGRPPESPNAMQAKRHYISQNDLLSQFVDELLIQDDNGFITNNRLDELFKDFSGNTRLKMKQVRDELEERWFNVKRDIRKIDGKTYRGLLGLRERMEGEKPVTKLQNDLQLHPEKEKNEKSFISTEISKKRNFETSDDEGRLPIF